MIVTLSHSGALGKKTTMIEAPKSDHRMLHIQAKLPCTHYAGCGQPTDVVLAKQDKAIWSVEPVCARHGYAPGTEYGALAELASIERFVASEKHLPADQVRALESCDPEDVPEWEPDPESGFGCQAWKVVFQSETGAYQEAYVVWDVDLLEFALYEQVVSRVFAV